MMRAWLLFAGLILFGYSGLLTQTKAVEAPKDPLAPVVPAVQGAETKAASADQTAQASANKGQYAGTWKVELAVFDYLSVLKDVSSKEGQYVASFVFGANAKGSMLYKGKSVPDEMEYEFKETGLTLAYGSRLKPITDLFQVLILDDGRLLLKSRRLGSMNGTMLYILKRQ